MIRTEDIQDLLTTGGTVVSADGETIGTVAQVFLDDGTGEPEWVTVASGAPGAAESFVPLRRATLRGDRVVVPYDRSTVAGAPPVHDADGRLSAAEEAALYRYYRTGRGTGTSGTT